MIQLYTISLYGFNYKDLPPVNEMGFLDIYDININVQSRQYNVSYIHNDNINTLSILYSSYSFSNKMNDISLLENYSYIIQTNEVTFFKFKLCYNDEVCYIELNVDPQILEYKYMYRTITKMEIILLKKIYINNKLLDSIKFDIEKTKKKCLQNISQLVEQPKNMSIKLFNYQLKTLTWMQYIENKKNKHYISSSIKLSDMIIDSNEIINLINIDTIRNEILYNNEKMLEYEISGGILGDEMGLGKTITMIALILKKRKLYTEYIKTKSGLLISGANLVICQNHLIKQWYSEIKKCNKLINIIEIVKKTDHEKLTYQQIIDADIVLVSLQFLINHNYYSQYIRNNVIITESIDEVLKMTKVSLDCIKWHRIIIDEGHELLNTSIVLNNLNHRDTRKDIMEWLIKLKATNKWIMSGTAFTDKNGFDNMMMFLDFKIKYNNKNMEFMTFVKNNINYLNLSNSILDKVYRRNTKDSVQLEFILPDIETEIIFVEFTKLEKEMYNQSKYKKIEYLRQLCCHPNISTENQHILGNSISSLEDVRLKLLKFYEKEIEVSERNLKILDENKFTEYNYAYRRKELVDKMNKNKYLITTFNNLNPIAPNLENEECMICLENFTNPVITNCGHIYCEDCLKMSYNIKPECPLCRNDISNNKYYLIVNKKNESNMDFNIYKYGSKMAKIIEKCKEIIKDNNSNRIIIFSQWDRLLHLIGDTLILNDINTVYCKGNIYQKSNSVTNFKRGQNKNNQEIKVIMLSLTNTASGTNLTEASHIIFVHPIDGTSEEIQVIENQAIGRAHRLGQNKKIKILKFITKDTIEETLFNNANANAQ